MSESAPNRSNIPRSIPTSTKPRPTNFKVATEAPTFVEAPSAVDGLVELVVRDTYEAPDNDTSSDSSSSSSDDQ